MSEPTDFYKSTRWPLALQQREAEQTPVYHDRLDVDGVPYRGPRETWSEEQYERRTREARDFQNYWFNLFRPEDLALYRQIMGMVANGQAQIVHCDRKESVLPADGATPTQWVYLEWVEKWMEMKPNSMSIEDLGMPPPPENPFR